MVMVMLITTPPPRAPPPPPAALAAAVTAGVDSGPRSSPRALFAASFSVPSVAARESNGAVSARVTSSRSNRARNVPAISAAWCSHASCGARYRRTSAATSERSSRHPDIAEDSRTLYSLWSTVAFWSRKRDRKEPEPQPPDPSRCVLCGRPRAEVKRLIGGLSGAVCDDCVRESIWLLEDDAESGKSRAVASLIVSMMECDALHTSRARTTALGNAALELAADDPALLRRIGHAAVARANDTVAVAALSRLPPGAMSIDDRINLSYAHSERQEFERAAEVLPAPDEATAPVEEVHLLFARSWNTRSACGRAARAARGQAFEATSKAASHTWSSSPASTTQRRRGFARSRSTAPRIRSVYSCSATPCGRRAIDWVRGSSGRPLWMRPTRRARMPRARVGDSNLSTVDVATRWPTRCARAM